MLDAELLFSNMENSDSQGCEIYAQAQKFLAWNPLDLPAFQRGTEKLGKIQRERNKNKKKQSL